MKDITKTIEKWGYAHRSRDLEQIKELYAHDSTFEKHGIQPTETKVQAWKVAEFDYATNTYRSIEDAHTKDDVIYAVVKEKNEWLLAAGIEEARYDGVFRVEDGKIMEVSLHPRQGTRQATEYALAEFRDWAKAARPEELAEIMPEGVIQYSAESGKKMVHLLQLWNESKQ